MTKTMNKRTFWEAQPIFNYFYDLHIQSDGTVLLTNKKDQILFVLYSENEKWLAKPTYHTYSSTTKKARCYQKVAKKIRPELYCVLGNAVKIKTYQHPYVILANSKIVTVNRRSLTLKTNQDLYIFNKDDKKIAGDIHGNKVGNIIRTTKKYHQACTALVSASI